VGSYIGGTSEARRRLERFVSERLARYPEDRNRLDIAGTSDLSAYLHFGQVSVHAVALAVRNSSAPEEAKEAYLEELIVRRELAVNFVARNPDYGRHDRPWPPRPVFGSVRYMSEAGAGRKFDVRAYVRRINALERGGRP
jgi:deoxyribodipyrimidine photo-lyase